MTNLAIQINLNLSDHCIETAIRRRYNRCLSRLLRTKSTDPDQDKMIEGEIDLLKTALESLDFSYLRSTWPELAGHGHVAVSVEWGDCHQVGIRVNGHLIR
jgi:hypothetical protein